jgi:ABC-type branched-subunit amino acid transport system ATPase component
MAVDDARSTVLPGGVADGPLLEVRDLAGGYGQVQILWGASLRLQPGRLTALIGSNGAGKTTLLRAVMGELRPTAGSVLFEGREVRGLMAEPKVLMLDELSLGLSPVLTVRLFETLRTLRAEGLTMLLVEQNVRLALAVSDYAYVLSTGRTVLQGPAAEIEQNDEVRRAYLGL